MATKSRLHGLNGAHTSGIFSDMTVDGPEIGTLVVIVDRAKNLPNRKTIGKQDPYCAARLGKEAKKTETDRRGGQTPRWDQELRYTVHDSPDYYQLKVSVFNDDKKTDLIGETWVDLKEVVVPGGGQNDLWHTLGCKGKYAGEIRVEITYYDTRPKQERPSKVREAAPSRTEDGAREPLRGPRQAKGGVKRRPLPSDPVTGEPSPVLTAIPDHVQTPPRGLPSSPTAAPTYAPSPSRGYNSPSAIPDHVQTPPRGYQGSVNGMPDHVQTPPRDHPSPLSAVPDHVQRGVPSSNYIPNQSPLQNLEYNIPSPRYEKQRDYGNSNEYGQPSRGVAYTPTSHQRPDDPYEMYNPSSHNDYNRGPARESYEEEPHSDPRDHYSGQQIPYDVPPPDDFGSPPSPGGPPPPPPAHRSRTGSSQASPAPVASHHNSYGSQNDSRPTSYYTRPSVEDAHRHSAPSYPGKPSYQAYSPEKDQGQVRNSAYTNYQQPPLRRPSYDARYNADYESMQPSVEDAPPSPRNSFSGQGNYGSHTPQYNDPRYDKVPSPAPLNLSGRGSAASGRNSVSTTPSHQYSSSSISYNPNDPHSYSRDRSTTTESVSTRTSYNPSLNQPHKPRSHSTNDMADIYGLPEVPATLVAGMDPFIAQEIAGRIYDEKRGSFSQSNGNSARGRYQNPDQYQQNQPSTRSYYESAGSSFVPAAATFDDRQSRYSTGTGSVAAVQPRAISPNPRSGSRGVSPQPPSNRGISPNPRSATTRKSVSPSPAPSDDRRRLSGVPFGPDSYNALNPALSDAPLAISLSAVYDTKPQDPDAKIITYDGREIDPSDHIPESNYAPLLESKGPKYASQQPDRSYRPPPDSTPVSATGRRPLKQATRPQSMASSSPVYINNAPYDPSTPPLGGARNRLQKKANRMSAQPVPTSSPLAPIAAYNENNSFTPKSLPRAHTMDAAYTNENHNPSQQHYGGSPGSYRGAGGPPIPAKVPVQQVHGPPSVPLQQPVGADAWALLEEMKSIDLGTGRARRRGY